ncbi:dihydrofolate reductase family protein [Enterococcus rivorum]|uniref:Riboflavin biosynthesis protein RibD n=1 Tax=Enterococcus rivorum TaxID=762845 RepID=A0A1E5KZI1_9ENTE|nr:dihydrofolate reductase family protein [Enterococcus rivorum]MBP2099359.1 dihydrofolate reductase [Enterococcus rivorum]OEH83224.1 riboflavin biosynthesis protein RibD [Enterococcus rivorum]
MSREVILYIATSLDGYIAEEDGKIDFLNNVEVTEEDTSYEELLEKIDTVIMGRTTYHQVTTELAPDNYPYEKQTSYIITHHPEANTETIIYTKDSPVKLVEKLKEESGKAIWIVGGGSIVAPLVEANLIDTYIIATLPIVLGKGIPLFPAFKGPVQLKIDQVYEKNGMVYTTYSKK